MELHQTVEEVVYGEVEKLTSKECKGVLVDSVTYGIFRKKADKLARNLGEDLESSAPGGEVLYFHSMPIYEVPEFPLHTVSLMMYKPSCLFCHGK